MALLSSPVEYARNNPIIAGGLGAVAIVGSGALVGSAVRRRKKKTTRGIRRDRKFVSKQKHERRYKRKTPGRKYKTRKKTTKKKTGKVYYTKNGQPYKIMASGKARFIKGKRRKKR
jgi:hypothetical protein